MTTYVTTQKMPTATNFTIITTPRSITNTTQNSCTYTLEYSLDGVNWMVYGTYTDVINPGIGLEYDIADGVGEFYNPPNRP